MKITVQLCLLVTLMVPLIYYVHGNQQYCQHIDMDVDMMFLHHILVVNFLLNLKQIENLYNLENCFVILEFLVS